MTAQITVSDAYCSPVPPISRERVAPFNMLTPDEEEQLGAARDAWAKAVEAHR